jgi:hypothetical protein
MTWVDSDGLAIDASNDPDDLTDSISINTSGFDLEADAGFFSGESITWFLEAGYQFTIYYKATLNDPLSTSLT